VGGWQVPLPDPDGDHAEQRLALHPADKHEEAWGEREHPSTPAHGAQICLLPLLPGSHSGKQAMTSRMCSLSF
jgi:hypothetical protein